MELVLADFLAAACTLGYCRAEFWGLIIRAKIGPIPAAIQAWMSKEICDHVGEPANGVEAPKILVVDDDPLTQRVLQHYLQRVGYRMIGAGNGREALRLARHEMPQLIILDVMMPGIDGWTVLRQLKKVEATRSIPVILLSSNADLMASEESLKSGATQLLVKPISPDQLLTVIRRLVPVSGTVGLQKA